MTICVTEKELHELMDELFDAYGPESLEDTPHITVSPVKRNFNQPGTFKWALVRIWTRIRYTYTYLLKES